MNDFDKGVATRLRRIEGQVGGLLRMLDGGRECEEVLTQISAVRSSLDQVALLLMERHIENCLVGDLPVDPAVASNISEVLKSWARYGLVPGARADLSFHPRPEDQEAPETVA
jgi:DNA-binding FrmR family transcriptional regulator